MARFPLNISTLALLLPLALVSCGTDTRRDESGLQAENVGTLAMTLRTEVNGIAYRLRDAEFRITNQLSLFSETNPDATVLTTELEPDDYSVRLTNGWRLEKEFPGGFQTVEATLVSPNPQNATIASGQVTQLNFAFETDGVIVGMGNGTLEITVGVADSSNPPDVSGPDAHVLLTGGRIARLETLSLGSLEAPVTVVGLTAGDTLVSIDRRPQNGFLYALGVGAVGDVQLYALQASTGQATAIGGRGLLATPLNPGVSVGIDFNPSVDRLRAVTQAGHNFRVNPNTGDVIIDSTINGATTTVDEAAYTNSAINATVTTLYTMSGATDQLFIQNPPNAGTQTMPLLFNTNVSAVVGFDIEPSVQVLTNNAPATGFGHILLKGVQAGDVVTLIDLPSGGILSELALGTSDSVGLALQKPASVPIIALSADGTQIVRLTSAAPGTSVSATVTGVAAGETLVGIDFRPQTGQLFGLGVNATTNSGTLYLIDPQTGVVTAIGAAGQIAFVDTNGNPLDLPADGYGFDFNPTVDRVRIVTGSGLNFRINPNNGAPVDGDGVTAGIQPDLAINGAATGVDGAAYTNSFGQSLSGGVTTLYAISAATNALYIQNPANNGTLGNAVSVTLNGAALNFSEVSMDIQSDVVVAATGSPVSAGSALAALRVGGTTALYSIDLVTGEATQLGTMMTAVAGLAVGQTAVH